jgi:hypothetical protein
VFTEQDVAMLSSVLNSDRAVQVNIEKYAFTCRAIRRRSRYGLFLDGLV